MGQETTANLDLSRRTTVESSDAFDPGGKVHVTKHSSGSAAHHMHLSITV